MVGQAGDGVEQADGVGMVPVAGKDVLQRAIFHNLSRVHDAHLVAGLRHDAQVVGDHDDGGAKAPLQVTDHRKDLRLDGHVQRRGGFVSDQQKRIAHQRDGDDHALTHAAGKLVGVFLLALPGNADLLQDDLHPLTDLCGGEFLGVVQVERLADLILHGEHRVQSGHGVLKDHGDLLAPHPLHLQLLFLQQIVALQQDAPRGHPRGALGQQAHHAKRRCGLARAGFTHQAQCLSGVQVEADMVHRIDGLQVGFVDNRQVLYGKNLFTHALTPSSVLQLGIQGIGQAVAHQVEGQRGHQYKHARDQQHIGRGKQIGLRVGEH